MKREEFSKIILLLNAAYKQKDYTMISDKMVADMWYEMLKDLDYPVAEKAVRNLIARSPYEPHISDVREEYARLVNVPSLGAEEAWAMVRDGIRNGTYGATEEFNKFPPAIQKAVGNPMSLSEWAMLTSKEVETVIHSQFLKAYEATVARAKDEAILGRIGARDGAFAIAESIVKQLEEKE